MKRRDQRIKVMTCLYQYFLTNRSLDDLFDDNLDIDDKESIAFIVEETVSTVNNYDYLRGEIEKNLVETWEFDRLGFIEQSLLLMSANEILIDETDKGIVINEAVEIAKKYCDDDAPKLINGVLDKLC